MSEGREVLRALLVGAIRFTPVIEGRRRGFAFEARIALDKLLSGVVATANGWYVPNGTVEDCTIDAHGGIAA